MEFSGVNSIIKNNFKRDFQIPPILVFLNLYLKNIFLKVVGNAIFYIKF